MDQEPQHKGSNCPVCGGSRWWTSRTGWRICQLCYQDPLQALQVLANRAQDASQPASDDHEEQLIQGEEG
jgi:hypothetical protein